jgi:hypothetical protein
MTIPRRTRLLLWTAGGLALLAAILLLALPVLAQPPEPHQYIEEYVGPATCETCHGDVTTDVIHTAHYSWSEKMDHYNPIAGTIARINWLGMLNEKLNIPGGCGRCHISGVMPVPADQVTPADRAAIDCLICHSPIYDTSLRFPVQDENGDWSLTQDRGVLAARQAQRPSDENCLFCHLNVGGSPMAKRGVDFAPVADKHGQASLGDVHAEAGMVCVDCHASTDHKVAGYGPSLWSRDLPDERLACQDCHGDAPHQDSIINDEHFRLDCRTCHVVGTGGLVFRDWTAEPIYDPVTELYATVDDVQAANSVGPVYRWFNGDPVVPGEPWPGDRTREDSYLQPFKEFKAIVPVDSESGEPVPLKLGPFYSYGDLEKAIEVGAQESGMEYSGTWKPQEVSMLLQISHGVVDADHALTCQDCHVPDGRLDFASLGYRDEEVELFTSISSAEAGVRQPLQMNVVIPEPQPLPTPVLLSGDVEAARGLGIRIPWNPILALLVSLVLIAGAAIWLRRQRPASGGGNQQA